MHGGRLRADLMSDKRICTKCSTIKPHADFHRHGGFSNGINCVCKECRKQASKKHYKNTSREKRLYDRAKSRAKQKARDFNIELSDIVIPRVCPVLGTPMKRPSLDRIDNTKGYVKDNVRVISHRANTLKNDATAEELRLVAKYIEGNCP